MSGPLFFIVLIVCSIMVHGFYSMMEMAALSFNRVRLHYYVSIGIKRARWLSFLLEHPGRLFGTTLIVINTALQFGSESARQFYESIGLSPDLAPLTQVLLVLVFAELSPMFAARKCTEHVAMLGTPLLYLTSKILAPVILILDAFCRLLNRLLGSKVSHGVFLTRDELQKAIESRGETSVEPDDFDLASSQIFSLKSKTAKELMAPIEDVIMMPSHASVKDLRVAIKDHHVRYIPVCYHDHNNIIGIIYSRDLIRLSDQTILEHHMRTPWFIPESTSILEVMAQFRTNKQSLAIVLDINGKACGVLTLDAIVNQIFGVLGAGAHEESRVVIERSYDGDTSIEEINLLLGIALPLEYGDNLSELVGGKLGHPPSQGEIVRIDDFELIVEEVSLLGAKRVRICSV